MLIQDVIHFLDIGRIYWLKLRIKPQIGVVKALLLEFAAFLFSYLFIVPQRP